jgi:hypothetical protein
MIGASLAIIDMVVEVSLYVSGGELLRTSLRIWGFVQRVRLWIELITTVTIVLIIAVGLLQRSKP